MPMIIAVPLAIALGGAFLSAVHPAFGFIGAIVALSWVAGLWLAQKLEHVRAARRAVRRAAQPIERSAEEQGLIERALKDEAEHGPQLHTAPF